MQPQMSKKILLNFKAFFKLDFNNKSFFPSDGISEQNKRFHLLGLKKKKKESSDKTAEISN